MVPNVLIKIIIFRNLGQAPSRRLIIKSVDDKVTVYETKMDFLIKCLI